MLKLKGTIFLILMLVLQFGCSTPIPDTPVPFSTPELHIYPTIPSTLAPTITPWPEILYGTVLVSSLNIRQGPSAQTPVIGKLRKGDGFFIIASQINSNNQKWYLIPLPNKDNAFGCVIGEKGYVTGEKKIVDRDVYSNYQRAVKQAELQFSFESESAPIRAVPIYPTATNIYNAPDQSYNNDGCSPSYPTVCIPPLPPDLDCDEISERNFPVDPPDPHNFDGDGIGCEGY